MKIISLFLVFLCSTFVLHAQNCTIYRKGYFSYTDSAGNTHLLKRRKQFQYEYDRANKIRTQYRIKWIDNCSYTITQTLTNSKAKRKFKNYVTIVKITKADGDNGYYYTCVCKDEEKSKIVNFVKKISRNEFYKVF